MVGTQNGRYPAAGMIEATVFRSAGVGGSISVDKIGLLSGPIIGGPSVAMYLPTKYRFMLPRRCS
jgi:hypothetical protein